MDTNLFDPGQAPAEIRVFQLPTGTYKTPAALAFRGGSFRDQRDFAATAILVQHPSGDILIDAGFGADAEAHIASLPSFRRAPHDLGLTASEQLDAAEYDRSRLLGVVLTHSHWDHVSGLDSLRGVPVWLAPGEREYAERAKADSVFRAVSAGHELREYAFEDPPYLGFEASYDFYGDGSVVIVPAAGHTPGSVIVFVNLPTGIRYAFIGDLVWQLDGITRNVDRPLTMRVMADSSPRQVRRDLARIIALEGQVRIVPAHDPRAYDRIPHLSRTAWTGHGASDD